MGSTMPSKYRGALMVVQKEIQTFQMESARDAR
jgi:hypothetical protein